MKAIGVAVYERREEIPDLKMVGLVHYEVILLVPDEYADKATLWLTKMMENVGDSVVNGDRPSEKRVPIKAETTVCISWADKT